MDKDLMAMKVTKLKKELAARDEALSGNKLQGTRRGCAGGCTRRSCGRTWRRGRGRSRRAFSVLLDHVCNGRVLAFYSDFAPGALLAFYSEIGLLLAYPDPMENMRQIDAAGGHRAQEHARWWRLRLRVRPGDRYGRE